MCSSHFLLTFIENTSTPLNFLLMNATFKLAKAYWTFSFLKLIPLNLMGLPFSNGVLKEALGKGDNHLRKDACFGSSILFWTSHRVMILLFFLFFRFVCVKWGIICCLLSFKYIWRFYEILISFSQTNYKM